MSKGKQNLYFAAEGGKLYYYDMEGDILDILFEEEEKETLMGLAKRYGYMYVGAKTKIYRFKRKNRSLSLINRSKKILKQSLFIKRRGPDWHQMSIIDNCLYITATRFNEIWQFDLGLNLENVYRIRPPIRFLPIIYKRNYNHINNIFKYNGKYYICLNWLTSKQYGPSGVLVLDNNMKEIRRFEYGWETHNFSIIDNDRYALCGSSGALKKINHPHKSGLMVASQLVFEHDSNAFFCKDFSVDDSYIYIVGGSIKGRGKRGMGDGVLFVLDRDYNLVDKRIFKKSGGFCGCILENRDLINGF